MPRKSAIALMGLIFTASLFLLSFGCTLSTPSPIVGKWQYARTNDTMEFTSGGSIIVRSKGYVVKYDYQLAGIDVVKVMQRNFDPYNVAGDPSWVYWVYQISGDSMNITSGDQIIEMKRLRVQAQN